MEKSRVELSRRGLLKTASAGIALLAMQSPSASGQSDRSDPSDPSDGRQPIQLSAEHHAAVNRRRRIVVQYDAQNELGIDFDQWLAYRFNFADEPGSQIDSLWWDLGALGYAVYPSKILERYAHEGLVKWWDQGIDWVARLVEECHKRNLETFWHHRISEVETILKGYGADMDKPHPLKVTHPDWVLPTWWKHGLWNLAVPEVRDYTVNVLREVAENYDFDGMQIDFARHIPCLPPGRQWELRDTVTDLMRRLRLMTLEVEQKRGRPFLLAAKVPRNLGGCQLDGFDVEAWAKESLVDIFTLGTRSMDVDIAAFRAITAGRDIKLQPCFDDHHTTDAYQYPPAELFRGVSGNWWHQGADSVYTFNWSNASPDACKAIGATPGPESQRQAYHEVGSPETLQLKDKMYAVERRGGYPWAEGYFGRNDDAPLPAMLPNDGQPISLSIRIGDPVRSFADKVSSLKLRLILFDAEETDELSVVFSGISLTLAERDATWKDKLIFSPKPQLNSGCADHVQVDPNQRLLRLDFTVEPAWCRVGLNQADVRVSNRGSATPNNEIKLEKVEVHVQYAAQA